MTELPIIIEGPSTVTIASQVTVVADDREVAWAAAKEQMHTRPDVGYLIGRYLGTGVANENGHIFRLSDIEAAHNRIVHTPLNMLHRATHVIGTFAAANLVVAQPDGDVATSSDLSATGHVEALAAVWRYVFPDEWETITAANEQRSLFYSMEAIPKSVTCPTCVATHPYAGPASDTYCDHMAKAGGPKILDDPLFVGGAIVVPPAKPGWRGADITELASASEEEVDRVFEELTARDLDPVTAEALMGHLLAGAFRHLPLDMAARLGNELQARDFPSEQRQKMAKSGVAMPDGSFPIPDRDALRRAINSFGRSSNQAAVKRHIIKRAKALGLTNMLPDGWT